MYVHLFVKETIIKLNKLFHQLFEEQIVKGFHSKMKTLTTNLNHLYYLFNENICITNKI